MTTTTTIQKWGNSQGIRIPRYILDSLNWSNEEQILIKTDDKKIIIERQDKLQRKNIAELFADFNGDYEPVNVDWGEPRGNEIW